MSKVEVVPEKSLVDRFHDAEALLTARQAAISSLVAEYREKQTQWGLVDTGSEIYFTGNNLAVGDIVRAWVRDWRARMTQAQQAFHVACGNWAGLKQQLGKEEFRVVESI